jgi:hypothetical protein
MTQDQPSQDQPSQDQPNSEGQAPQRFGGFLDDQQSRRLFLKAAVISGAAVAAVGVAGAAAASASPQLLRQIRGEPATASGQVCIDLAEASHGDNPNSFLEVTNADWATLMAAAGTANPCIRVTDKRHPPHIADLLTTVVCTMPKGSAHTLLGICPVQTDIFPAGSGVCLATGCPPSDTCGPTPCS